MSGLNDYQTRSILSGFLDIHQRMADMEAMLDQSTIDSPFAKYVNDLSPTEARVVRDYFTRLRDVMGARLQATGIPLEVRRTSLRWALQCGMTFLSIAVAEMAPKRLEGYGRLAPDGEAIAVRIQQELNRLIDRVNSYLRQGLGRDLPQRLARLDAESAGAATLTLLDEVTTRWQLVEFRPTLDAIVRRLTEPRFEIAVFGRVSSGKSSLLNHIAGRDVLPVGVTPVTAVPTWLTRGEPAAAVVSFAEREPQQIDVSWLREYASEEGNPGNQRHVTGIVVRLPSPRLREGVVLVDTPGIGSLALSGSAETFAYLPRCDLGVVLIDAGSSLNPDDLLILRSLQEAAVPAQVLLSKADLVRAADRERMLGYIRDQVRRELGLDVPVSPVSTVGAEEVLLTQWFGQEIEPLLDRHRALAEAFMRRKIAHLRESVLAVLETLRSRGHGGVSGDAGLQAARQVLDRGDEAVRAAHSRCLDWTADDRALVRIILDDAAGALARAGAADHVGEGLVRGVAEQVLTQRGAEARALVTGLRQVLGDGLAALQRAGVPSPVNPAVVREVQPAGLPVPDLSPLRGRGYRSRPWWGALLPRAAVGAVRNSLARELETTLNEVIGFYDRQLRNWIKGGIAQVVEAYESQAEVVREQLRRLLFRADGAEPAGDAGRLGADIQALKRAGEAGEAQAADRREQEVTGATGS
jgi:GTP-binding protein EngB required for normal cell division